MTSKVHWEPKRSVRLRCPSPNCRKQFTAYVRPSTTRTMKICPVCGTAAKYDIKAE